jgi:hypothetical protein
MDKKKNQYLGENRISLATPDGAELRARSYKIAGRTFIVESRFSGKARESVTSILARLMRLDDGGE